MKMIQRFKALWFFIILVMVVSMACGLPKLLHHDRPELSVTIDPFLDSGCTEGTARKLECPAESPLADLSCRLLYRVPDLFGGLEPSYAMVSCHPDDDVFNPSETDESDYVYNDGCMRPRGVWYIVHMEGDFHMIKSRADLQKLFAPIETENEALSYAQTATGFSAYYDLQSKPGYRYHVDVLRKSQNFN